MKVTLTVKEVLDAARWADEHNRKVHNGTLQYADISVRNLEGVGIGVRTIVTCEFCDRMKVRNENDHDVTDYGAW